MTDQATVPLKPIPPPVSKGAGYGVAMLFLGLGGLLLWAYYGSNLDVKQHSGHLLGLGLGGVGLLAGGLTYLCHRNRIKPSIRFEQDTVAFPGHVLSDAMVSVPYEEITAVEHQGTALTITVGRRMYVLEVKRFKHRQDVERVRAELNARTSGPSAKDTEPEAS